MPVLRIYTNVPRSKIPSDFLNKIIPVLVEGVKKEAETFVVVVEADSLLTINCDANLPGVSATLESIGNLGPEENKLIAKLLTEFLHQELGVPPERFVLTLYDMTLHNVAKWGTTIAGQLS